MSDYLFRSLSLDQARIIPAFHRHKIFKKDSYADKLVQSYLSFRCPNLFVWLRK